MNAERKQIQKRNTKQRKFMLQLLQSTKSHPNAFWLYDRMKPEFPNLSLSTVYRNLGILEEEGMIQKLTCCTSFDRYDADISMHSHFYCRECNRVYDIETNDIEKYALENAVESKHQVEGCNVTLYGVCKECCEELKQN